MFVYGTLPRMILIQADNAFKTYTIFALKG